MKKTDNTVKRCPVCGNDAFQSHKLDLVKCQSCDRVVSPDIWLPKTNVRLNKEWFGEDYEPEKSIWDRLFEARNNHRTPSRLRQQSPIGKKLLEVGVVAAVS